MERFTLDNGLRVVLAQDRSAPVVGVNVTYDVGFRSEPEGRSGFAHLFEHLMFQGSANVAKLEHARHVQGNGGVFNGSTHPDFTNYFEVLPAGALELGLFLEADRMAAPTLTEENLRNQCDVVKEEIRVNVLNQPYGGFPWIHLPALAFDTYPNAHDGYGAFAELEAATVADCQDFHHRYYAPGNAVLTVLGDLDLGEARGWVEKHFAGIAAGEVPPVPDCSEPLPTAERRGVHHDAQAPQDGFALGYRVPDPQNDWDAYLANIVLAEVLTEGEASRLRKRLVLDDRLLTSISGYLGTFGDPFEMRHPTLLTFDALLADGVDTDTALGALDSELGRLARDGISPGELARVQARLSTQLLRMQDSVMGRLNTMAVFEQQRGDAALMTALPGLLTAVTPQQVAAAAAACVPEIRTVLEVKAGAA